MVGIGRENWILFKITLKDRCYSESLSILVLPFLHQTFCKGRKFCYCPSVGDCENYLYEVTFPHLHVTNTHEGDHHRDYHLTLTVTNLASLQTTATFDLLLDDSPPTRGVVWEGFGNDGQAEMDFTSQDTVHVHWHGFEDHESGVRLYRAVLANRCLTMEEVDVDQSAHVILSPERSTIFTFNDTGNSNQINLIRFNLLVQ